MEKMPSHHSVEGEKHTVENTLDAAWFPRIEKLIFTDYKRFEGNAQTRAEAKRAFLANEVRNPHLDYPYLEDSGDSAREADLLALKHDVLAHEKNGAVKQLYRTRINELLASLAMMRAAKEGNDHRFARYADFIYGHPTIEDSAFVAHEVHTLAEEKRSDANEDVRAAAERLSVLLTDLDLQHIHNGDHGQLPDHAAKGESVPGKIESLEEAIEAFEAALQELGAHDWTILVDTDRGISNFSVDQEKKVVHIPSAEKLTERNISKKKLRGLIEHEIRTHVARRVHGERSKLQLLGIGLDRYVHGEEGVATFNEQRITGVKEFAGIPRFFSVMIAKGLDGAAPRDFHDTFAVMRDYRLLMQKTPDIEKADRTAYDDCVRIFRGSTCETPGAVYPKDMAYFTNKHIWTLVAKDESVVETFRIGKFDPTNAQHIVLLTELGILDQDLERLADDSEMDGDSSATV